jgi:hypothetical protein
MLIETRMCCNGKWCATTPPLNLVEVKDQLMGHTLPQLLSFMLTLNENEIIIIKILNIIIP